MVARSSSLMKERMGVCRNLGMGLDITVGSRVEASDSVSSSCIRSIVLSSNPVYIVSIQAGW